MKHTIRWILVSLTACAICAALTYRIAYHSGYCNGYREGSVAGLVSGDFTESLGFLVSLQKLRGGYVPAAIRWMESICFGRADIFLKYPAPNLGKAGQWIRTEGLLQCPGPDMARSLAKGLALYRAAYRTNSADWDTAEKDLDAQMTKIKSEDYQAWARIAVTN